MKYFYSAGIIIVIILQLWQIRSGGFKSELIKSDTTLIEFRDRWHPVRVEVPVPYKVEVPGTPGSTVTIPATIDSMAVIMAYYSAHWYSDTIGNDTIQIAISQMVSQNRIQHQEFSYRLLKMRQVTNTIQSRFIFAGLELAGPKQLGMYVTVGFDTRRWLWSGGYDPFNRNAKIGLGFKINR